MSEIRLTPSGHLQWLIEPEKRSQQEEKLAEIFGQDWVKGLFVLAADKYNTANSLSLKFWQGIAERYLTELCHISESDSDVIIDSPPEIFFSTLILSAPPMEGGEYITILLLQQIWGELCKWGSNEIAAAGSLSVFLEKNAPQWHQVGRVCFHLAENKADEDFPFAFLATYSTGFGCNGKLRHLPLRKAMEEYAGKKNRSALIKLLMPVDQASQKISWVREIVESGEIYQPLAWSVFSAHNFLKTVPTLEDSGLIVRIPNWWKKRPRPQVSVTIDKQKKSKLGLETLLDFDVSVVLEGHRLSREEIEDILSGDDGLVMVKGQWIEVDREKLKEAIDHWQNLQHQAEDGEISFIEGMRLLAGASADLKEDDLLDQDKGWFSVEAGGQLREMLSSMRQPVSLMDRNEKTPKLKAQLRPYQQHGLTWLSFITELGLGGCLADDMGLGKTIQVLALLLRKQKRSLPSLLIVPASLLGNWRKEAERFAPSLKLTFLHPGQQDRSKIEKIAKKPKEILSETDLCITTYSMLSRQEWLREMKWQHIILDEAQAIKNPATRQTRAVKKLQSVSRLALTGTPIENKLDDLWSLFDFINPGLLGSASVFKKFVKRLQEGESCQFTPLQQLVQPYILRRLKTDRSVINDLPDKVETVCYCNLSKKQIKHYERTIQTMKESLENSDGMARRGLVLQSLLRLKQICNHPSQLTGDFEYSASDSGKFQRLKELCEEIASRQEKVLIFTQFREIIEPLSEYLAGIYGRTGVAIHGGTAVKYRQKLVDEFQQENGPPFFILSLKAGGTGLNLTAASHVIHFDRWWNPAVENQATDRAFRIGQKKSVMVHKFVTTGTVEEKIDFLIAEKQKMADDILSSGKELNLTELSDDEIIDLVSLDVTRAKI